MKILPITALALVTTAFAGAQQTSRPSGQDTMTTSKQAAPRVETATFALG